MEFKVGDRVKVVGVDMEFMDRPYVGKTGTIYRISGYLFPYHVQFNNDEHVFNPECLRKVESEREFKVGDRVHWTYEGYSGTGVIVKHSDSERYQWYVKRDITGGPLNDYLFLDTSDIALIDSVIKVGDIVKIARPDNATDNQFVGKIGKVVKIIEELTFPVLVNTGESERWYSFKALEKNTVITEYHGFRVGDAVAVRGSGFTGKIAEFATASTPGGITVVVMNDRGERRGITTTDIEKAIVKRVFDVGDWVKITEQAPQTLSTAAVHIGKVDKVSGAIFYKGEWLYRVQLYFYPAHSLITAQAPKESKPESTRLKVGDRVRVVKDTYDNRFVGKTGKIEKDDQTKVPFLVRFDDGDVSIGNNGTRWFYVDELVKIEDAKPVENKIKVGDMVKVVGKDNQADSQFVGRTGEVTQIDIDFMFPVGIYFDGYGFRRFSEKCVEVVVEKQQEERKLVERLAVGDKVKVVNCTSANYGEIGTIIEDDGSNIPFFVKFDGDITGWCKVTSIEKVNEEKQVDDWRARFEAFKMSHPVGTKVKIARKVETDKHAMPWVPSMDGYIGETLQVVSYGYNKEGDRYTLSVGKFGGPDWNYPIDALEDVTETNQYTFTVKPSDVDLKRIWEESNPDFAVVVDYDKKSDYVEVLHKGKSVYGFVAFSVEREKAKDAIETWKRFYDEEKKQRVTVTIY